MSHPLLSAITTEVSQFEIRSRALGTMLCVDIKESLGRLQELDA